MEKEGGRREGPNAEGSRAAGKSRTGDSAARDRGLQRKAGRLEKTIRGLIHEWRNALQEIEAFLGLLRLHAGDSVETVELFREMDKVVKNLQSLHEDASLYVSPLMLERRPCDAGEVWRRAWAQLTAIKGRPARGLEEDVRSADLLVSADPHYLEQALAKILVYCLARAPARGGLSLRCFDSEAGGKAMLGIGICHGGRVPPPEEARDIFEPFFIRGTCAGGLELAVASRLIKAHGGRVALAALEGGRSEIVLLLPRG